MKVDPTMMLLLAGGAAGLYFLMKGKAEVKVAVELLRAIWL